MFANEGSAGWKGVYWMLYPLISRMSRYSWTSATLEGNYVVGNTPHSIALRRSLLIGLVTTRDNGSEQQERTGSSKVSQKLRSIRVTTRPGASGVPRWSSLKLSTGTNQDRIWRKAHLAYVNQLVHWERQEVN